MKIFIHVDSPELEDVAEPVAAAIAAWVDDCGCTAQLVNEPEAEGTEHILGLRIDTSKKAVLKKALDFLYGIAREQSLDFAVGFIDKDGTAYKVCYFGEEEGKPDINEIGSYLGLRR